MTELKEGGGNKKSEIKESPDFLQGFAVGTHHMQEKERVQREVRR